MSRRNAILAAVISLFAAAALAAGTVVYKIELAGSQVIWSKDRPQQAGNLLLFHRHPGGLLMSVKKNDVRRVVATPVASQVENPGARAIDLGPTGDGSRSASAGAASGTTAGSAVQPGPRPGERSDGSALFNPNRPYRPDWDSKQVPGMNVPYPASRGDYREGYVYAYPPASAAVPAPGEPPTMKQGSGEVPRGPQ
jgi:hypothetical protein